MGAFVAKIAGKDGLLDAFVDPVRANREFGSEQPERLELAEGKYVWFSIRPDAGAMLPAGAHVLKVEMNVLVHFPEHLDEDDVLEILIHRLTEQYSEATLTYQIFELSEEANGNWPPEVLSKQEVSLPVKLSDAQLM